MLRARHREGLGMCSSQVTRWAQNALRWGVRRAAEIGTASAGGTGKGRRAGGVRVTGWPLWPSGSRSDRVRCDTVRCVCMWVLAAVKSRRTCCLQAPGRAPARYRELAPAEVRGGQRHGDGGTAIRWSGWDSAGQDRMGLRLN